jgi:hypothetical protein
MEIEIKKIQNADEKPKKRNDTNISLSANQRKLKSGS